MCRELAMFWNKKTSFTQGYLRHHYHVFQAQDSACQGGKEKAENWEQCYLHDGSGAETRGL